MANSISSISSKKISRTFDARFSEFSVAETLVAQLLSSDGYQVTRGDLLDRRDPDLICVSPGGDIFALDVKVHQTPVLFPRISEKIEEQCGYFIKPEYLLQMDKKHLEHYQEYQQRTGVPVSILHFVSWLPGLIFCGDIGDTEFYESGLCRGKPTIRGYETEKVYCSAQELMSLAADGLVEPDLADKFIQQVLSDFPSLFRKIVFPARFESAAGVVLDLATKMEGCYALPWATIPA